MAGSINNRDWFIIVTEPRNYLLIEFMLKALLTYRLSQESDFTVFVFETLELRLKGEDGEVYSFLKSVGGFRCEHVRASGHYEFYSRLFVEGCFRFDEAEICVDILYELEATC